MPALIYPNAGALWLAGIVQTALAAAVLHLFQDSMPVLTTATELTTLVANEATYTGYVDQTITTWLAPLLNPLGGASIESGLKQFSISTPYTVPNVITGWWIQASTSDLVCAGEFTTGKGFVGPGDGIPMNVELIFGG
jgi:hypothetical protein